MDKENEDDGNLLKVMLLVAEKMLTSRSLYDAQSIVKIL
jgi:hypothetical protein